MNSRRGFRLVVTAGALLSSAACGTSEPVTPQAPEFDAKVVFRDLAKGSSRPMVVDWTPDDRASLETRASRGAILVRITDAGIEPLWDCTFGDGARYEFTGVSPKRDHVDAKSDAELAANFPMSFAKLRSELRSGRSLTADIRMIGVSELNRLSIRKTDLPGECRSATHFVKELTIGGFQFGSSAYAQGDADVGIADFGAKGAYRGLANRLTEEGDFSVCENADPDSPTAPSRCKGILRIRLVPVDVDANEAQTSCGAGLRWNGRGCVELEAVARSSGGTSSDVTFECQKDNLSECVTQCKKGNAASCTFAGHALLKAKKGTLDDFKTLYTRACEGKHWEGCSSLAEVKTVEEKEDEATKLFALACTNGFSGACTNFAVSAYFGRGGAREDRALAFKLWDRACRLGDFTACSNAGVVVLKGEGGIKRDPITARKLFDVACKNGDTGGCSNLGFLFEVGVGGPRDPKRALSLYLDACEKNHPSSCVFAGLMIEENSGGDKKRAQQALSLYDRACDLPSMGDGCATFAENKATFGGIMTDEQLRRRSCDGSTQAELGCFNAAFVYANDRYGLGNDQKMGEYAIRACKSEGASSSICQKVREMRK